jgi:predicted nucleic acid-binding protein
MNADRVFLDTNVLTYLFDYSEPKKQAQAARRIRAETREIFISTQVLQELYVSLTKGRNPIATVEVAELAVREASQYAVVHVDTALVFAGIEASRTHRISFWDALIVRAAVQADCEALLTEDLNAGQIIDGVRIDNPFA